MSKSPVVVLSPAAVKAQAIMATVNAAFKQNVIGLASAPSLVVTYIETGVFPFDFLLQGGLPRGRFVEIFGDYSTLKSYVGLKAIASVQRDGGVAALIDTENAFDPQWATSLGVDTSALLYQHPENGEKAIDLAEALIRAKVDLIVFDSVAATLPKSEQQTELGGDKNIQPARLASLMSLAMRKLTAANDKTAVLWINQTRVNVGVMFGSNEAVPGGKALPFYASMRIAFRKAGRVTKDAVIYKDGALVKGGKETVALTIKATLEKSKLNKPFREVYFNFDLTEGATDDIGFLINQGLEAGSVFKSAGYWWSEWDEKKYREGPFKDQMMMDRKTLVDSLSRSSDPADKSKDDSLSVASSGSGEQRSTPTPVQVASKTTGRTVKRRTK